MSFDDDVQRIWRDRVDSRFLFRGMSAKDLTDPLDPDHDPFEEARPRLLRLLDVLQELLDAGFQFRLREEHFGNVSWHDLQDIVTWTRRDLQDRGIDFASRRDVAREYADCFQGSQLKQNVKTITDHLPRHRDDPVVLPVMTQARWHLVSAVAAWVSERSSEHRRVVIAIRRSCPPLESEGRLLPVGDIARFRYSIDCALAQHGLDRTAEHIGRLLVDEARGFDVRLRVPLPLRYIETFEDVGGTGAARGAESASVRSSPMGGPLPETEQRRPGS